LSLKAKNKYRKDLRICLAASAGGHMLQLLRVKERITCTNCFFLTSAIVIQEKLRQSGNVYIVGECNYQHPWKVVKVFIRCLTIVLKEKPDIVISTGAAPGCIMCFLGKLFKAKVIWLDSITNVEKLSLSGRMVRSIADLFLVQWPDLTKKYKNVEFAGAVI